jgi:tetratricopeptide (TPR) repeat protein
MQIDKDPSEELRLAIEDFSKAIKINPQKKIYYENRAKRYTTLATWLMQKNDDPTRELENALNDYKTILKISPEDAEAYHSRGFVYFYLATTAISQAQNPVSYLKRARRDWKKASGLSPENYKFRPLRFLNVSKMVLKLFTDRQKNGVTILK